MKEDKHVVLITGAAGYVGAMLVEQWSARDDVTHIVAVDKETPEAFVADNPKTTWVHANTADSAWEDVARKYAPDIVVHAAWQIRNLYGNTKEQWRWNVEGSERVFDFAFNTPSVTRLVYFSTASLYGAYASNTLEYAFTEEDPMRDDAYRYAYEKRIVEEMLHKKIAEHEGDAPRVSVVRPAAITGPRGRFMRERFGLQSALSGKLSGSVIYKLVTLMTSVVPATKKWCRQFVHEDDVVDIVTRLAFGEAVAQGAIFNLAPGGAIVRPADMAAAVGKKVVVLPPRLIGLVFFVMHHATLGKIPTSKGSWRFYSYPIVMDGSKVENVLGHTYCADSLTAFTTTSGRYAYAVPEEERQDG